MNKQILKEQKLQQKCYQLERYLASHLLEILLMLVVVIQLVMSLQLLWLQISANKELYYLHRMVDMNIYFRVQ